ncbi:hypothetical protein I6A60_13215 [Frankia sp. AgB1.9]|uniref:hypothetical protein n=1 Tax=unclassified Frankia TaxID=2632575 RepID=UPI0019319E3B|nr:MULTISPECIES: hypothetical protein [unclassified Frankia]MBL7491149.1 hypothetical protein [Frankia sp. AgW1.1]MBL7548829.1 hypothetical protein [Frankia sp. AgB1.9]MBL7621668.1 hypothetical protein [Frankia sp. AgB1.8]
MPGSLVGVLFGLSMEAPGVLPVNRLGSWIADRWRREVAKTVPARTVVAGLRADRGLRIRVLLALGAYLACAFVAFGLRPPDTYLAVPAGLLVGSFLVSSSLLATVTRLNVEFTDAYLAETWRSLAGLLEAEVAAGDAAISTRTIGGHRAVAVTRRAGPNLVVAVYPWRREVWVAVGEYEFPQLAPSAVLSLVGSALRGGYSLIPGRLFRRGRPAWLLVTTGPGRRLVGRRRRTSRLAGWETVTGENAIGET